MKKYIVLLLMISKVQGAEQGPLSADQAALARAQGVYMAVNIIGQVVTHLNSHNRAETFRTLDLLDAQLTRMANIRSAETPLQHQGLINNDLDRIRTQAASLRQAAGTLFNN